MCWKYVLGILVIGLVVVSPLPKRCGYEQYSVLGQSGCRACPKCPAGSGMNDICQNINPYRPDNLPHCGECIDGRTWSAHNSSDPCYPCAEIETNYVEDKKCTRFQNRHTVCGPGLFVGSNGVCDQPCCLCDYKSTKMVLQSECQNNLDGKFCSPNDYGKCDLVVTASVIPPTASIMQTTPDTSAVGSTRVTTITAPIPKATLNTTVSSVNETTTKESPTKSTADQSHLTKYVVIAISVTGFIIICLAALMVYWKISGSHRSSNENISDSTEDVTEDISIRIIKRQISDIVARKPTTGERRLLLQGSAGSTANNSRDMLFTGQPPTMESQDKQKPFVESHYETVGPYMKDLSWSQRQELAIKLDPREGVLYNWLQLGFQIAGADERLQDFVNGCHQSYYGGGSASMQMFEKLSIVKPLYSVTEFVEVAKKLLCEEIIQYIKTANISTERFSDIAQQNKNKIAAMMDRHAPGKNYWWRDFAEKFGFSLDEAEYFQMKIKEPGKYSPTIEMIMVLVAYQPNLTVERFQNAAIAVQRNDIKLYLDRIMPNLP